MRIDTTNFNYTNINLFNTKHLTIYVNRNTDNIIWTRFKSWRGTLLGQILFPSINENDTFFTVIGITLQSFIMAGARSIRADGPTVSCINTCFGSLRFFSLHGHYSNGPFICHTDEGSLSNYIDGIKIRITFPCKKRYFCRNCRSNEVT